MRNEAEAITIDRSIAPAPTPLFETPVPTAVPSVSSGSVGDLLLKVTPPRVPRHLVARERLLSTDERMSGHPVILVQAPAGFGKTSLLAQWRREHLARGTIVAWLSAQPQDDPVRLVHALALAVRTGAGRPSFGHTLLAAAQTAAIEGITGWLAEVAHTALDIVLIVDEAERLPPASIEALAYLLRNAPANLRVVIAARADCHLGIDDLVDYDQCLVVGPTQLRFDLGETIALVRSRLGGAVDDDAAARLHELAEGWPLGLQLALTVMSAGADPRAEIGALSKRGGGLHEQFVGVLLANLAPDDLDLLTRIAFLDDLHPALCSVLVDRGDTAERLARMRPRHSGLRRGRKRASGCACTRWRATCCASASPRCPRPNRPSCTDAQHAGWPSRISSRRRRTTPSQPGRRRLPTSWPSAASTNR